MAEESRNEIVSEILNVMDMLYRRAFLTKSQGERYRNARGTLAMEFAVMGEENERLKAALTAPTAPTAPTAAPTPSPVAAGDEEYPEAAEVCGEAYQVVGCLLDDLGIFDTPEATKILDNLSQHRLVHRDVLPWVTPAPSDAAREVVAYVVPSARVMQDGSYEDGPDSLVFADEADDYVRRVGTPLYRHPAPAQQEGGREAFREALQQIVRIAEKMDHDSCDDCYTVACIANAVLARTEQWHCAWCQSDNQVGEKSCKQCRMSSPVTAHAQDVFRDSVHGDCLRMALEEIRDYEGDPNTPVRNSAKKSAIARAALATHQQRGNP